jgi:hypothetical protein
MGAVVQASGIGPVHANTILLNWIERSKSWLDYIQRMYARNLRAAFRFGCNLMVLNASPEDWARLQALPPGEKRIDVWWRGDATSRLMLLLAYLIHRNSAWEEARIRVLSPKTKTASRATTKDLAHLLEEVRIEAEPVVVEGTDLEGFMSVSSEAALALVPFRLREDHLVDSFGGPIERLLPHLPITLMVLAAEDIDLDAEPEEGLAGQMAAARDSVSDWERRLRAAEKDVADANQTVEKIRSKRDRVRGDPKEGMEKTIEEQLAHDLDAAQKDLDHAKRKLAKVKTKAEEAERAAEALGVKPADENESQDT